MLPCSYYTRSPYIYLESETLLVEIRSIIPSLTVLSSVIESQIPLPPTPSRAISVSITAIAPILPYTCFLPADEPQTRKDPIASVSTP